MEIRSCNDEDDRLFGLSVRNSLMGWHHHERYQLQKGGQAVYLLAWEGDQVLGSATLLNRSKYPGVREVLGDLPEMNGLNAAPMNNGTGTALIRAVEAEAHRLGFAVLGLAVALENLGAHSLYTRLGYTDWGQGHVVDHWEIPPPGDNGQFKFSDTCDYLTKDLVAA